MTRRANHRRPAALQVKPEAATCRELKSPEMVQPAPANLETAYFFLAAVFAFAGSAAFFAGAFAAAGALAAGAAALAFGAASFFSAAFACFAILLFPVGSAGSSTMSRPRINTAPSRNGCERDQPCWNRLSQGFPHAAQYNWPITGRLYCQVAAGRVSSALAGPRAGGGAPRLRCRDQLTWRTAQPGLPDPPWPPVTRTVEAFGLRATTRVFFVDRCAATRCFAAALATTVGAHRT